MVPFAAAVVPLLLLVVCNNFRYSSQDADNVLHIGGIFPIGGKGGWQGGQACEPAVRLALEDVNKHSILSGYQLKLHWNDSEVSCPRQPTNRTRAVNILTRTQSLRIDPGQYYNVNAIDMFNRFG